MIFAKIISLGWKNIWRNPTRSGVVIIAVLLGIWAGVFISAFFNSLAQGYLQNHLDLSVGHIQIAHPKFEDQFNPKYDIDNPERIIDSLRDKQYVRSVYYQSLSSGLAQSAANSYGVTIHGIDTAASAQQPIAKHLAKGDLLRSIKRNPVVVGQALADRLKVDLRSKIVVSFQDMDGNITAGAFRIAGIFDSFNRNYDKGNIFVLRDDLNRLLEQDGLVHRVTLKLEDFTTAPAYADQLAETYPNLKVAGWGELAPELEYVFSSMDLMLYIVMIIIIIALVFSIVNTMLMAVMERTRELGMLMAVGMSKFRLFMMILFETFFLTMVGTPLGLLLGWLTITILGHTGIDLGAFAAGLSEYGMDTVIYPELGGAYYLNVSLLIAGAAILSSLYPAWKTMKLKPVEAIRKL